MRLPEEDKYCQEQADDGTSGFVYGLPEQLHVRHAPPPSFVDTGTATLGPSTELSLLRLAAPDLVVTFKPETIDYLIGMLKSYPAMFIRHGKTSFMHQHLYHTPRPRPINAAYRVCSCYRSLNPANQARGLEELNHLVRDLVKTGCEMQTFQDLLAAVQGLILSQIVRLFGMDGVELASDRENMLLQQVAEPQQELLQRWTYQLWQRAPAQMSSSLSPWRTWLIGESVRRTILIAHLLRAVYSVVRQGYFVHTLFHEALPFDVHTELWEAPSADVWESLGPGLRPTLVSYHEFTTSFGKGPMSELSEFELILLNACKGVQDIN